MISNCNECGCNCRSCFSNDNEIHLHVEIEHMKQKLLERDTHIIRLETNFLKETDEIPSDEFTAVKDELVTYRDKYERLCDAHKRVQRVNQGLEDKLLKLVDICQTDKNTLTKDVAVLSQKLAESNYTIKKLTESNERYKDDVALAIQFLQCKQGNFVAHKFDSLPPEVQTQVSSFITYKKKPDERKLPEPKSITVPIPTFPPTAMVYSIPKTPSIERHVDEEETPPVDIVSAAIMAKVLEERLKERSCIKHCDTCTCSKNINILDNVLHHSIGTQTSSSPDVCWKCNESIQPSYQAMKLSRTSDIANTKVPTFLNDSESYNNIVKVQPNNFLVEESSSNTSSLIDVNTNVEPVVLTYGNETSLLRGSNHNKINNECKLVFTNENEKSENLEYLNVRRNFYKTTNKERNNSYNKPPIRYFRSDTQSLSEYPRAFGNSSLISQNASSNILSENIRNEANILIPDGWQKNDLVCKQINPNVNNDSKILIDGNQLRVEEWVQCQTSLNDKSRSDNSRTVETTEYAEMEKNVKQFLFGRSELWKDQSGAFQNIQHHDRLSSPSNTFSHTQTEI